MQDSTVATVAIGVWIGCLFLSLPPSPKCQHVACHLMIAVIWMIPTCCEVYCCIHVLWDGLSKRKSGGGRLGILGAHSTHKINCSWKSYHRNAMLVCMVWQVAPSCWNHISLSSPSRKVFNCINVQHQISSKNTGSVTVCWETTHHADFLWVQWNFMISMWVRRTPQLVVMSSSWVLLWTNLLSQQQWNLATWLVGCNLCITWTWYACSFSSCVTLCALLMTYLSVETILSNDVEGDCNRLRLMYSMCCH